MDEGYTIENGFEGDEAEHLKKDPVKKYHFEYNKSVCMSKKYPEADEACDDNQNLVVTPGAGEKPKNILQDKHWDIKAFPHLHNWDGSNGKDQERRTNLREQQYFIQRILNKEQRFVRSADYMYAAVAYLEKKQIQRNISIAGTRGNKVTSDGGKDSFEIKDPYLDFALVASGTLNVVKLANVTGTIQ